jgi:hypothetical protein
MLRISCPDGMFDFDLGMIQWFTVKDGVQHYEGLREYFYFYNHDRSHQSLEYKNQPIANCKKKAA